MAKVKVVFYCCPKPFQKEFEMIQHNAIQSWKQLNVAHEIVLLGHDAGVAEYANKYNLSHIPDTEYGANSGTPIVSSLFKKMNRHFAKCAGRTNSHEGMYGCYINADIILNDDFSKTLTEFHTTFPNHPTALMVGQRHNWDLPNKNYEVNLQKDLKKIKEIAKCQGVNGIDYFVFEKNTFTDYIYDFALGKFYWDVWLLGNAWRRGLLTIDLSKTVFAIHQNSPWYQGGKVIHNSELLRSSSEGMRNVLFENHAKNIKSGTRCESKLKRGGQIVFVSKL